VFTAKHKCLASIIVLSVESLEFSAATATHTHTHTHTQHTQHAYTNHNDSADATSGIPVAAASHLHRRQPLLPLLLTPRHRLKKESRSEKCPIYTAHEACTQLMRQAAYAFGVQSIQAPRGGLIPSDSEHKHVCCYRLGNIRSFSLALFC
jgi:hypothetical protein